MRQRKKLLLWGVEHNDWDWEMKTLIEFHYNEI